MTTKSHAGHSAFGTRPFRLRTERARAGALFGILVAVYLLTLRGHLGSRDEESLYMTAVMLEKGAESTLGLAWTAPEPGDQRTPLFRTYEIGQPLLAIPFYLAGDRLAAAFPPFVHTYVTRLVVTLFTVLVTAATGAQLYRFGRRLGYSPRVAAATALAYGLGTLAWPYSRTFFRDPLAALAVISATLALAHWRAAGGWRPVLAAGAWLLVGVATKFTTLIIIPLLAVYALSGPAARCWWATGRMAAAPIPRWRRLALAGGLGALGVLVGAAGVLGLAAKWDELRGHYYLFLRALAGSGELDYVGRAFYGLTLSPGKGLLEFAPPVLAGLLGLAVLARRQRAAALLCAGLPLLYTVFYSFDGGWHGGATWGPRYLLPVLPLLMLPCGALAAAAWTARRGAGGRLGLAGLGLLLLAGGVVQLAGLAVDPIHYYLDVLSRRPLTLDAGPTYLQEIHFDPALSPIPGHLALAARDLATLAAGRTNFYPVPYEPVSYWQYFQYLAAPDSAWVDLYAWQHPGGYSAALNHPARTAVVADAAAKSGRATQAAQSTIPILLTTPRDPFPSGRFALWLRLRRGATASYVPVVRVSLRGESDLQILDAVPARSLPDDGTYGVWRTTVDLDYTHPVSFEVRATGVTTVTLDGLWLTPFDPRQAVPWP